MTYSRNPNSGKCPPYTIYNFHLDATARRNTRALPPRARTGRPDGMMSKELASEESLPRQKKMRVTMNTCVRIKIANGHLQVNSKMKCAVIRYITNSSRQIRWAKPPISHYQKPIGRLFWNISYLKHPITTNST